MTEATEPTTTDEAADHPSITVEWTPDGLAYNMHRMSAPILHGIAAVLHHEAEKMLFHADMAAMEKARSGLVTPNGRH